MTDGSAQKLAPYALTDKPIELRAHPEPPDPLRSAFEVDRHRIISCTAFRRLEHKTQVFAPGHHDHFRTRLTHTLEASHIARTIAAALGINQTLAEAITLAHDLGHPPFGHAGEAALAETLADHGGFNHNLHTLRVVEYLEHPYPAFRGLNLTRETLHGLRSHASRFDVPDATRQGSSAEAQASSIADRVAYDCHDLEDAIGAELIRPEDLHDLSLWRISLDRASLPDRSAPLPAIRRPLLDALLASGLEDVIETSKALLAPFHSPEEVLRSGRILIRFSSVAEERWNELESFLADRLYRHPTVKSMDRKGRRIVQELFDAYRSRPELLPPRFAARVADQGRDIVIRDYIAGMTDRWCKTEHERHCRASS